MHFGINSDAQLCLKTFGEEVLSIGGTGLLDGLDHRSRLRFASAGGSRFVAVPTRNCLRIKKSIRNWKDLLIATVPSVKKKDWDLAVHPLGTL